MSIDEAVLMHGKECRCGKVHRLKVKKFLVGKGAIVKIPSLLLEAHVKKVFLLADTNTYRAAGERVEGLLLGGGIAVERFVYEETRVIPDEKSVGAAVMHFSRDCDAIVAVGSGVINDIGKLTAAAFSVPYMIVGTAPSMDGYASNTASMERDGLKTTLPAKTPDYIVGDSEILSKAPERMLLAGIGDMLAKYISICEWRISSLVTGEYYCEEIAELMRGALRRCMENAKALLRRDEEASLAFFEALVVSGIAMSYAEVSRPASGIEHYFSHIFDMRGLSFGTPTDLHGIQCGVGTVTALKLYEKLLLVTPDREKALRSIAAFDYNEWKKALFGFIGNGAKSMILAEKAEQKFAVEPHARRLENILAHWEGIRAIIQEELPSASEIRVLMTKLGAPTTASEIGIDECSMPMTFYATKDVRKKYILSHLAWDLGILTELM